jgi:hypothetical protein
VLAEDGRDRVGDLGDDPGDQVVGVGPRPAQPGGDGGQRRWLADPVHGVADRCGDPARHAGQVDRCAPGDLVRDELRPSDLPAAR